ncbi:MAG: Uma2 family endonuclease [Cyanobacteria bacterium]|nr:Uma2 family endonuclease [Cyanobacteriota bacterium]
MIAQRDFNFLSPESYLDLEQQATVKHEYSDGEIYAMAGASATHIQIVGNLYAALRNHLRGTGCDLLFSDIKVRIDAKNCFYYPDLIVTCDDRDRENDHYRRFPKLIVEVLSDSTEARDRGDKFEDYSTLDSLQEYVLIAQKKMRVECFRRTDRNRWTLQTYGPGDRIQFSSIDWTDAIETIYEDITFAAPSNPNT